eukprot:CAMPEP_0119142272 /NCGR_PEP_ID=MMETSP1310-20130426/32353_1 /TAXON_ID=464262 /ORGANISM="Genus nov. species nov., Strain RCC2339" /LENGTH=349 /DNA_ID=CAMNT_0007133799 /DNA_START=47 /DNA_END=1093 /DNA_ORIENTATION=-
MSGGSGRERYGTLEEDSDGLLGGSNAGQKGDDTSRFAFMLLVAGVVGCTICLILLLIVSVGVFRRQNNEDNWEACDGSTGDIAYSPYYTSTCFAGTSESEWAVTRPPLPGGAILLTNLTLWDGTANSDPQADMELLIKEDGTIGDVGPNVDGSSAKSTVNLNGAYVTPGIVDMHSHMAAYSWPDDSSAANGANEMTFPNLPQMRVLDSLSGADRQVGYIRAGGVTTSLVLPGSGNVMGGEAMAVKHRDTYRPSELIIEGAPRHLKMACGENPMNTYGSRTELPSTRMGVAYRFRQGFFEAAQLRNEQDQWDCGNRDGVRPQSLDLAPLVDVLRGQVRLNVHCYKVEDLE